MDLVLGNNIETNLSDAQAALVPDLMHSAVHKIVAITWRLGQILAAAESSAVPAGIACCAWQCLM